MDDLAGRTVLLTDLPMKMDFKLAYSLLLPYGEPESINLVKSNDDEFQRMARVVYKLKTQAVRAVQNVHGREILGCKIKATILTDPKQCKMIIISNRSQRKMFEPPSEEEFRSLLSSASVEDITATKSHFEYPFSAHRPGLITYPNKFVMG